MNIFGKYLTSMFQHWNLTAQKVKDGDSKSARKIDDADGPGAGGGYFAADTVEIDPGDGPGAGGGYVDSVEETAPGDGPGAGGGYDDSDGVDPGDADGPGAGGGYNDLMSSFGTVTGTLSATWTTAPEQTMTVTLSPDGNNFQISETSTPGGDWYIGGMTTPVPVQPAPRKKSEGKPK